MRKLLIFLMVCYSVAVAGQSHESPLVITKDSLWFRFSEPWKYKAGDNPAWASPDFNDSLWISRRTWLSKRMKVKEDFEGICWMRVHFKTDSSLNGVQLALTMTHYGASEIYMDGVLIKSFGKIGKPDSCIYYDPQKIPFVIHMDHAGEHVLAVRYANYKFKEYNEKMLNPLVGFNISMYKADSVITNTVDSAMGITVILMVLFGIFFTLSFLHFFLYLYNRKIRSNLYFAIFSLCMGSIFMTEMVNFFANTPSTEVTCRLLFNPLVCMAALSLSWLINELFLSKKHGWRYWGMILLCAITSISRFISLEFAFFAVFTVMILVPAELVIITIGAIFRKQKGSRIIGAGVLFFSLFLLTILGVSFLVQGFDIDDSTTSGKVFELITALAILSIPVSMSAYLAWNMATMNKNLASQLNQIGELSEKNIQQELEKQRMLETRKEELEREVELRIAEITRQKQEIERQNILLVGEKEKVEKKTDELGATLDELKRTQQSLIHAEKMASLGQLTAGIAHEIQNPLNFVNNFSGLSIGLVDEYVEAQTDEERKDIARDLKNNLSKISHHGKRAEAIVKGMLMHSRTSSDIKQPEDVNALCEEAIGLSYHSLKAKYTNFNVKIEKHFAESVPMVKLVSLDISRVLINLMNNALYAMATGHLEDLARLTVSTTVNKNYIEIKVSDNGPGIPPEIRSKIFDPFFTTKPTGEGTGLGLSICYDIIKSHGGEMTCESEQGVGTSFVIKLPLN